MSASLAARRSVCFSPPLGSVAPGALRTPDAKKPQIEDGVGVRRVPLVAGEDQAGQPEAAPTGDRLRGRQIGPERVFALPGLEAVIVGERVRSHFLAGAGGDEVDQRAGQVLGIVLLVGSDRLDVGIELGRAA